MNCFPERNVEFACIEAISSAVKQEHQAPCTTSSNELAEREELQQKRSKKEAAPHKRGKRELLSMRKSLAGCYSWIPARFWTFSTSFDF